MIVPKPPPWDSKAALNAWAALRKPDGSPYNVFQNQSYMNFIKWVKGQRDHLEALRVGVFGPGGIKSDLDDFRENNGVAHVSFDQRLKLLEAQQNPAFPTPDSG